MATESAILVAALLRLRAMNMPALPLHDSCLVAMSDAEAAKAVLIEEFASLVGGSVQVTIDAGQ